MSIFDEVSTYAHMQGTWRGVFSADVADFADRAYVILPEFDESFAWGPCRWQSRDAVTLPNRGDWCLIIFDNDKEPWIVAWWPYA